MRLPARFVSSLARPLFAAALAAGAAHAQSLAVLGTSPRANAVGVARQAPITISLSQPVGAGGVGELSVWGQWSGAMPGEVSVDDDGRTVRFRPARPFFAGEAVTVSLRGPAQHAFAFSAATARRLAPTYALGDFVELRRAGEGPIISYGATASDLDGDGDSDLAIPNEIPADVRVLLNRGDGTYGDFAVYPLPDGAYPSPSAGTDLDGDGAVDLVVGNGENEMVSVLLGDGQGGFPSVRSFPATGEGVRGIAVLDADRDGRPDVVSANRNSGSLSYFRGLGDGTFAPPEPMDAGGAGETSLAVVDLDEDGVLDLLVGALGSREIIALMGDGAGGFTAGARVSIPGAPWMLAAGDLDGDGHADVASAGAYGDVIDLVFGDGRGGLRAGASIPSGQFVVAIDAGDLDGDGDLDLVSSNYSSRDFRVFHNDGAGRFTIAETLSIEGRASCAILHDRDGDGAVDISLIDEGDDRLYFVRTTGATAAEPAPPGRVALRLMGPNPSAGAAVELSVAAPPGPLRVEVFDALGRRVVRLHDGPSLPSGASLVWHAGGSPPGVYVVRAAGPSGAASLRVVRR